jgi:hypothetical protein
LWLHNLINRVLRKSALEESKLAKTPLIPVVIAVIAFTVTFAGLYVFVIEPLQSSDQTMPSTSPTANPSLTPMTWTITSTSDENTVNIEVQFTGSNLQLVDGSGYTPDVSPMFLTGTISGTRLTLTTGGSEDRTIGQFSFTTDIITGTWNDQWIMVYEQEVYTTTNSLTLTRLG